MISFKTAQEKFEEGDKIVSELELVKINQQYVVRDGVWYFNDGGRRNINAKGFYNWNDAVAEFDKRFATKQ